MDQSLKDFVEAIVNERVRYMDDSIEQIDQKLHSLAKAVGKRISFDREYKVTDVTPKENE